MRFLLALFWLAAAMSSHSSTASGEPASALTCITRISKSAGYLVCAIDTALSRPRLFWKDAAGQPFRTFSAVADAVARDGRSLIFAMNAGMYADDYSPMGLYIEKGKELRPANLFEIKPSAATVPNFYKKPNGVFFFDKHGPAILPTAVFLKEKREVVFATQSGPMLVIDGETNGIFIAGSKDRTRRSGVGICEGGIVRFAISDGPVNFHDFAELFRSDLKCANALFLDGGRGAGIFVPALKREDWSGHGGYGPMIGVVQ